MIYAIDFDGTLCHDYYPEIGAPRWEVIKVVQELRQRGHQLILWTCRCDDLLAAAVKWCRGLGIEFDVINDNLAENKAQYATNARKVYADYYIDDHNFPLDLCADDQPPVADGDDLQAVIEYWRAAVQRLVKPLELCELVDMLAEYGREALLYAMAQAVSCKVSNHFDSFYEGEFIYLHVQNGEVVYIQQAIRVPY